VPISYGLVLKTSTIAPFCWIYLCPLSDIFIFISPSFIFAQKLKASKADLKRWNEQEFGKVEVLKQAWMEELSDLDRLDEEHGLAPEEKVRKCLVIRYFSLSLSLSLSLSSALASARESASS
jgi:hypothetical protein